MALLELEELAHHVAHPAQSPQAQPFHNVYLKKNHNNQENSRVHENIIRI
jgi:hypothetical protein